MLTPARCSRSRWAPAPCSASWWDGGPSQRAAEVALAWQGVTYGVLEPLLQRDIGLYVAQVPLWRAAHDFAFCSSSSGSGWCSACTSWSARSAGWTAPRHQQPRPGASGVAARRARAHADVGLPAGAVRAGGRPRRHARPGGVAGDHAGGAAARRRRARDRAALGRVGGPRTRHALAAAGWIVLPLASLVGHWMVPPTLGGEGEPIADQRTLDQFERLAYGLETLTESRRTRTARRRRPRVPSLWNRRDGEAAARGGLEGCRSRWTPRCSR